MSTAEAEPAVGFPNGIGFPLRPGVLDAPWQPRRDHSDVLNLKSCEMQHAGADRLVTEVLAGLTASDIRTYPYHLGLLRRLAELERTGVDTVLLTAGSCSAIGLVVDGLAHQAGRLLLQEPVFESWTYYAALRGVPVVRCAGLTGSPPLVSTRALVEAMSEAPPSVVALTNPGNPTGVALPVDQVAELAGVAASRGHLLVVDECYGAFSGINHVPLVEEFPNLLVIRSLSKSWALAGARVAVVFGAARIVDYLRRFRTDSTVSAPAVALAHGLSARLDELGEIWSDVVSIRDEFARRVLLDHPQWMALGLGGNFVTFRTGTPGEGERIERALAARRIRIRGLDDVPGLAGCVRFSLADRPRMAAVADVLREVA
jgi:histidinol-phosphate aminotransferase